MNPAQQAALSVAEWQRRIASVDGPRDYTMRLVLLVISLRMIAAGAGYVRLTREEIAQAAGLSRTWVITTARRAEQEGWLLRIRPPRRGRGRAWAAYDYWPSVPSASNWLHLRRDVTPAVPRGTSTHRVAA